MNLEGYTVGDFDRGASRGREALWLLVKAIFFLNAFPWPSALRVALLRAFGAKVGRGVVVRNHVNITYPWRFEAGDFVWLGDEVIILSLASVKLESSVCISQRAFLCTGSHAFAKPGFDLVTRPIVIRAGSWIAAQAFVAPGLRSDPAAWCAPGLWCWIMCRPEQSSRAIRRRSAGKRPPDGPPTADGLST